MRALAIGLFWVCLIPSVARATVFSGTHSLVIVGDGVEDGGFTAPAGFFDDVPVGTEVTGFSDYNDGASVLFSQCFNPNDGSQCYPVYGGGSFDLAIGAETLSSIALDEGGAFVILDDVWSFNPSTAAPIAPIGEDIVGLTFFYGSFSSYATLGSSSRWAVESISFYLTVPANTIADPASIVGVDFYSLGQMSLAIHLLDLDTGIRGTAFALVPEPSASLLMGLGLAGLATRRR